jgi:3-hydroxyisobutyrate dehydrogenase
VSALSGAHKRALAEGGGLRLVIPADSRVARIFTKLVLNNWLADLTEATAEILSFARRLDLDPAEIVDLLQSTPLGAPYAVQKARSMLAGDFSPAFALKHALKDAELATQAAQDSGATLTLTSALLPRWRDTAASGHADDDLSAVYLTT